jgi:hypothetical protein
LGALLPRLLGVFRRSEDIDFCRLPDAFALKCTHASGYNIICRRKSELNLEDARAKLSRWLKQNFSRIYGELHYARIPPRIVCEEYLGDGGGVPPLDYKVYCFNGEAHCVMVCSDRGTDGHGASYVHFDVNWRGILPYDKTAESTPGGHPKPPCLEQMIAAAERLSRPFPFVRVDFYCIRGDPVFGELTFTPAGCIDPDSTDLAQQELGRLIQLPPRSR